MIDKEIETLEKEIKDLKTLKEKQKKKQQLKKQLKELQDEDTVWHSLKELFKDF